VETFGISKGIVPFNFFCFSVKNQSEICYESTKGLLLKSEIWGSQKLLLKIV